MNAKLLKMAKKTAKRVRILINQEYVAIAYYFNKNNKQGGE